MISSDQPRGKSFSTAVFSPDGRLLAVGGDEQRTVKGRRDSYPTASLYEVATGKLVAELKVAPNPGARVRQVVFANGGRAVVTATDGTAQAWSAADGRLQANLPGGGFPLAVSPDGKLLAGSQLPRVALLGHDGVAAGSENRPCGGGLRH